MVDSLDSGEKVRGSYESDKQPVTIYHVWIVVTVLILEELLWNVSFIRK